MPTDAPPSYDQATGSSTNTSSSAGRRQPIPVHARRSMEDETRPLPAGWVRQFDPNNSHQFYVDTRATPPRSIWHHPYDDDVFMRGLPAEERERIEELNSHPSRADLIRMSSDEDSVKGDGKKGKAGYPSAQAAGPSSGYNYASGSAGPSGAAAAAGVGAPAGAPAGAPPKGLKKFGRSLKDKMTGTTHEQREAERRQRDIEEQREYEMHMRLREAMARAFETGQPQLIGRDRDGKDVYIEPPHWNGPSGYPGQFGRGAYGYNPYHQGPYSTPHGTYVRPDYDYHRPAGYGYGGGLGMPLMGGLLGGALLGGLLF